MENTGKATIELEFSEPEIQALSRVVPEVRPTGTPAPSITTVVPPPQKLAHGTRRGIKLVIGGVGTFLGLLGAITFVVGKPDSSSSIVASSAGSAGAGSETLASVETNPVRFKNPFDAAEEFEFPPGTSKTAARDAVAEILLKRAHEREAELPRPSKRNRTTVAAN